jgi:hypothetical protein
MSDILKEIAESGERARPWVNQNVETDIWKLQPILRYKSDWAHCLDKQAEGCETFRAYGDKFGFSEKFVNQLMWLAHKKGVEEGKRQGERVGWDNAMDDVAKKLGYPNRH